MMILKKGSLDMAYVQSLRLSMQNLRQPQLLQFLLQPRRKTGIHATTPAEDNRLIQTRSHIDIRALDGIEQQLGDTGLIDINEMRLEETLGSLEALRADADNAAVGKGVRFHQHSCVLRQLLVKLQVVRHVTQLLLNLAHRLEIRRAVQRIPAAQQQRNQVARHVPSSHIQTSNVVV